MKRSFSIFCLTLAAVPVSLQAQMPLGDLSASDARIQGAVVLDAGGTGVGSGSNITAGQATASLRLRRGGEVHICPHSSVSITASPNGRDLMLAMGTGAIETHYALTNSADQILTPDFRILLAGPGEFHFAVASDNKGNACIRSLPSNAASLIVSELLGDGVYQVRPGEQVLFRGGSVKDPASTVPPDCGCPLTPPAFRAEPQSAPPRKTELTPPPTPSSLTAPLPPTSADEVHISVDAPFVYRAKPAAVPPPPVVTRVRLQDLPPLLFTVAEPQAPPPPTEKASAPKKPAKTENKGLIGHLKSFFSSVFGGH